MFYDKVWSFQQLKGFRGLERRDSICFTKHLYYFKDKEYIKYKNVYIEKDELFSEVACYRKKWEPSWIYRKLNQIEGREIRIIFAIFEKIYKNFKFNKIVLFKTVFAKLKHFHRKFGNGTFSEKKWEKCTKKYLLRVSLPESVMQYRFSDWNRAISGIYIRGVLIRS